MRGTIKKRGNSLQLRIGYTDRHGQRPRINRTIPGTDSNAWAQAELLRAELNAQLVAGTYGDTEVVVAGEESTMTVEQLITTYLHLGSPQWTTKTHSNYSDTLKKIKPLEFAKLRLEEVSRMECRKCLADVKTLGASDSMLRRVHTVLNQMFNFAVKEEWITANPFSVIEKPKVVVEQPEPASAEHVRELLAKLEESDPNWHALVLLAFQTGMRRGELAALRWGDIDLDIGTVHIRHSLNDDGSLKDTKTHRTRKIAIDTGTVQVLQQLWERKNKRHDEWRNFKLAPLKETAFVFAPEKEWPKRKPFNWDCQISHSKGFISKKWNTTRRGTPLKNVKLHGLRHGHATELLATGNVGIADVSARLGHSKNSTTLDPYARAIPANDRVLADLAQDILHKG